MTLACNIFCLAELDPANKTMLQVKYVLHDCNEKDELNGLTRC